MSSVEARHADAPAIPGKVSDFEDSLATSMQSTSQDHRVIALSARFLETGDLTAARGASSCWKSLLSRELEHRQRTVVFREDSQSVSPVAMQSFKGSVTGDGVSRLVRVRIPGSWDKAAGSVQETAGLGDPLQQPTVFWLSGPPQKQSIQGFSQDGARVSPSLPSSSESSGSTHPSTRPSSAGSAGRAGDPADGSRSPDLSVDSLDAEPVCSAGWAAGEEASMTTLRTPLLVSRTCSADLSGNKRASPADLAAAINALAAAGRPIGSLDLTGCARVDDMGAALVGGALLEARRALGGGAALRNLKAGRLPLLGNDGAVSLLRAAFGPVIAGESDSPAGLEVASAGVGGGEEASAAEAAVGGVSALEAAPVRLHVVFAGCTDVSARVVAKEMGRLLGGLRAVAGAGSGTASASRVFLSQLAVGGCRDVCDELLADVGRLFPGIRELDVSSRRRLGSRRRRGGAGGSGGSGGGVKGSVRGLSPSSVTTAGIAELGRLVGESVVALDVRGGLAFAGTGTERTAALRHFSRLHDLQGY